MRRRILRQLERDFEPVNVTPLIDVVMCLIVFFLIVGKMASDAAAVRLPDSAVGKSLRSGQAVVISIARGELPGSAPPQKWGSLGTSARVFVDGQMIAGENELAIAIRERAAELLGVPLTPTTNLATAPVHVRADRDLPYSAVEPILRAAAKAGIPGVRLATERPS